jgi:uncharacterized protein
MKPLVIYHGGCRDGFCAAWVADRFFSTRGGADFHAGYYGHAPPDVRGRAVYVLDFSYSRPVMDEMHKEAASLLVLDHHKTAEAAMFGARYAEFDMNRSGAGMAWDHFFGGVRPTVVDYTEDRDLWRFALPHSKEVNAYLSTLAFDFPAWTNAETNAVQDGFEAHDPTVTARNRGQWVISKTEQYVREAAKNARTVTFAGKKVPLVNAPQVDISELLDYLVTTDKAPFAVGWWQRQDGVFQYSLRSRGDFDVSALAKLYGGGGHANAAGFQSQELFFMGGMPNHPEASP